MRELIVGFRRSEIIIEGGIIKVKPTLMGIRLSIRTSETPVFGLKGLLPWQIWLSLVLFEMFVGVLQWYGLFGI